MMGYRSKLIRSVIVLSVFYLAIAYAVFFALSPAKLQAWLEQVGYWNASKDGTIYPSNALFIALDFSVQTVKAIIPWVLAGAFLGFLSIYVYIKYTTVKRETRGKKQKEGYRGLSVTISKMPELEPIKLVKNIKIQLPDKIPAGHQKFINAVMNYINSNPGAFVGPGHKGSLLQHTANVMNKAVNYKDADPLLLLVAAAHDAGKVTSHIKKDNNWVMVAYHDKESAKFIARLDEWYQLDKIERKLILYAIKYEHSFRNLPTTLPGLNDENKLRLSNLIRQLKLVDGEATKEEKEEVLASINVEEAVFAAFKRGLVEMPFHVRGHSQRGVQAAGWRYGDRLYLIEHRVRDISMRYMDADHSAALGGKFRAAGDIAAFSQVLFSELHKKGYLITTSETYNFDRTEAGEATLPPERPLWDIWAGMLEIKGILIIELPEEERGIYPGETSYTIQVQELSQAPAGNRPSAQERKAGQVETDGNNETETSKNNLETPETEETQNHKETENLNKIKGKEEDQPDGNTEKPAGNTEEEKGKPKRSNSRRERPNVGFKPMDDSADGNKNNRIADEPTDGNKNESENKNQNTGKENLKENKNNDNQKNNDLTKSDDEQNLMGGKVRLFK